MNITKSAELTVGDVIEFVLPGGLESKAFPKWPPDAFAVTANLLRQADAYSRVVQEWPPVRNWAAKIRELGKQWRRSALGTKPVPTELRGWWRKIQAAKNVRISRVVARPALVRALLQLTAAADEASEGAGVPVAGEYRDEFDFRAFELLVLSRRNCSSLCDNVDPSRMIVLPRLHPPQSGINLRSLTHHLALCSPGEVEPNWNWILPEASWSHAINVLVVPWPKIVRPSFFRPTDGRLENMDPDQFGFFTCDQSNSASLPIAKLKRIIAEAEKHVGSITAIIFPEMALRVGGAERIARSVRRLVIAGEGRAASKNGKAPGKNAVVLAAPTSSKSTMVFKQSKHHRWKLDKSQICQYGLGSRLDPSKQWWENIQIGRRQLSIFSFERWLTCTALVCEDLAQQEPVAELVRSIGPHLLVALLMDGPQLAGRWPARYATVLAEDPGCSVLTVTSLGMSVLSRADGKPISRVVALWKERGGSGATEIVLPAHAEAVVLCLSRDETSSTREWTADGRRPEGPVAHLRLSGTHPIFLNSEG